MGGPHSTYLSAALADLIDRRRIGKLCNRIGGNGLVQALLGFAHTDKRLHTQSRLFLLIQQPFLEPMLRTAFLLLFPFPYTVNQKLQTPRLLCVFIIAAILVVAGMYFTPENDIKGYWYVNPITRLPDFIAGMLLFQLYDRLKDKNISLSQGTIIETASIALFFAFYFYAIEIPKVYRYSCYYWFPVAMILISFALQKGHVSRILSNRLLIIGGEISYSFYLIHLFVLLTYSEWQKGSSFHIAWYIAVPVLFGIIVLLSLLSYYYFEKPMNKRIKTWLDK